MSLFSAPLSFVPVYHVLVWGGRRMARWRPDLPPGTIGESWDLADHPRGMSVVAEGPLAGRTLGELTREHGRELVGAQWDGREFPLLVKLIDASDRLSVQVHPDDALAQRFGVGARGKTECWLVLEDGGEVYVGLKAGVTQGSFANALALGTVPECLSYHPVGKGDVVFLPARTVHALGAGTLVYEVQQTCDVTFRVYDWGRVGLDGKPRQLHIQQSLETIDYSGELGGGVRRIAWRAHPYGGQWRELASCRYFALEERRAAQIAAGGHGGFSIVICLEGVGTLSTAGGSVRLQPMRTYLVPAAAGPWQAHADAGELDLLIAR
ncbi:MAG: class I mannose-6-phosphate isomerase [Planctomycetota bacterium]|nr:class I mannose-6-phosphate isomerase [Planctomycetota bacterium]MCX8039984.1 class I mannose-6-phosphate isomerase [Planctomycetota bacterium]MDW8372948.1 class I mannose-6-phosphate isomerase [Planctomycetota bacterium]